MARKSASTTGVKLDGRTRSRLKALSRLKHRSQHWLIKEAIERYLDQEEDAERLKRETLERWERFEALGEHVSNAAIAAWLKSWGSEQEMSMAARRRLIRCPKPFVSIRRERSLPI